MKSNTLLLSVLILLFVGCSNKGNGELFYVEYLEKHNIVHSKLDCKAIKGGVESCVPGHAEDSCLMCSKCMTNKLLESAKHGRDVDDDDYDDDF